MIRITNAVLPRI